MSVEFRAVNAGHEPARSLIEATRAAGRKTYGTAGAAESPGDTGPEMSPPDGAFLVGVERDRPVACGGLTRLDAQTVEVKRMYVVPQARGRGLGRSLLRALEDEARRLGYRRARLDTGPRQPHARALYESAGYVAIAAYNTNPLAHYWAEKQL